MILKQLEFCFTLRIRSSLASSRSTALLHCFSSEIQEEKAVRSQCHISVPEQQANSKSLGNTDDRKICFSREVSSCSRKRGNHRWFRQPLGHLSEQLFCRQNRSSLPREECFYHNQRSKFAKRQAASWPPTCATGNTPVATTSGYRPARASTGHRRPCKQAIKNLISLSSSDITSN